MRKMPKIGETSPKWRTFSNMEKCPNMEKKPRLNHALLKMLQNGKIYQKLKKKLQNGKNAKKWGKCPKMGKNAPKLGKMPKMGKMLFLVFLQLSRSGSHSPPPRPLSRCGCLSLLSGAIPTRAVVLGVGGRVVLAGLEAGPGGVQLHLQQKVPLDAALIGFFFEGGAFLWSVQGWEMV